MRVVGLIAVLTACGGSSSTDPVPAPEIADPGRVTLHRLNRAEYNNTVRDLLLTTLTPADDFPFDDFGYGFDNVAEVLSISPLHLEMYELAADQLLDELLAATTPIPAAVQHFEAESQLTATTGASNGTAWNLWSNGTASTTVSLPSGGHYVLSARLWANQAGDALAQASLLVDGAALSTVDVPETAAPGALYSAEVDLAYGGEHSVGVRFENDYYDPTAGLDRNLYVDWVELQGPTDQVLPTPPGYAAVFVCDPGTPNFVDADCAREILAGFTPRAWRRPVTEAEVDGLMGLYQLSRDSSGDWYEGVRLALKAVLISPHFLFRVELDANPTDPTPHPVDPHALASRVSYFLWSSMPDDALFARAEDGTLTDPAVLEAEVARMLADPRAEALVENLAGQWWSIRAVDAAFPDVVAYPTWSEDLRGAYRDEMQRLAHDLLLTDRSMLDLFTRDDTWVDARLAGAYGLPAPAGDSWALTPLPPGRTGFLTTGGLLTALSYPTRTSPVRRGKWILGNLLCEAPAPPPPGVDTSFFVEDDTGAPQSLRDQFEAHRADPVCASCHAVMDPIGFSLEHFDGVGAWRTDDAMGLPIDASGALPDGSSFGDIQDLATQLAADPKIPGCMVEKTFTYALGRPPTPLDLDALDAIESAFIAGDHRFSALAAAIVLSDPFRYRTGEPEPTEAP